MSGHQWDMGELLAQDKIWVSRGEDGLTEQRLQDMTTSHLQNLRAWLIRNAGRLHSSATSFLYGISSLLQGDQALRDLDCDIAAMENMQPRDWLEEQLLFEAITRLIEQRERQGG